MSKAGFFLSFLFNKLTIINFNKDCYFLAESK